MESESEADSDSFGGFDSDIDEERLYYGRDLSDISLSSASVSSSDEDEWDDINDDAEGGRGTSEWSREHTPVNVPQFREESGCSFVLTEEKKEIDFFLKFFPNFLFSGIVRETNKYASGFNGQNTTWTTFLEEISAFLGLHVLFSLIPVPQYTMAWTTSWLFCLPGVGKVMPRGRFEQLSKYFHVSDKQQIPRSQPGYDKLHHVRPVIREIRRACMHSYRPPCEQTIDEGMVPFKGRLSFKQYLPLKPTKSGIKVWMRANPNNGHVHEFQIYTGRETATRRQGQALLGLSDRVVLDLTRFIQGKNHHVYMDSFFTNPRLLQFLLDQGTFGCGTVRTNRVGMPQTLKDKKLLKKQGESVVLQKGPLVAASWRDKRTVTFLATNTDPSNIASVTRRQKDGTIKRVPCPEISKKYGQFMNGVDRADQLRMSYPTYRKARKWWKYIFWYLFDIALCNAFVCMKESPHHQLVTKHGRHRDRTQLEFRMALAEQLIGRYRCTRKREHVSNSDKGGNSHWPVWGKKNARCRGCLSRGVRHEVHTMCDFCDVHLCIDKGCFKLWHRRCFRPTEE